MEKMLKRFKMEPKPSVNTPLPENFHAIIHDSPNADAIFLRDFEYRQKVGSILYYMICVRPDLAFPVQLVARLCSKPTKNACAAVTQLMLYAYNTRKTPLALGGRTTQITAFCDSDLGGCRLTRRSTGGYAVFLGFGVVALNVFEAEYMTLSEFSKSVLFLRWMLRETGIKSVITQHSSSIFCDNMAAIALASSPAATKRSKHIAIRYHHVRDLVAAGVVTIEHISTDENLADIFTKPLGRIKFQKFATMLLGYEPFQTPKQIVKTTVSPTDEYV